MPDTSPGNGQDGANKSTDSLAEPSKDDSLVHLVPEKFNDPQTSGIQVTVQAGTNDIPINLKSK